MLLFAVFEQSFILTRKCKPCCGFAEFANKKRKKGDQIMSGTVKELRKTNAFTLIELLVVIA